MNCSTHPIPVTYPATHSLTAPRRPAGRGTSTLELRLRQASHNRVNPQVTCALAGHLAWISKPSADSIYNMRFITDSGFFKTLDTATHIGDKGYIKPGIIASRQETHPWRNHRPRQKRHDQQPCPLSHQTNHRKPHNLASSPAPITAIPTIPSKPSRNSPSPTLHE